MKHCFICNLGSVSYYTYIVKLLHKCYNIKWNLIFLKGCINLKKYVLPLLKIIAFLIGYYIVYTLLDNVLNAAFKTNARSGIQYPSAIAAVIAVIVSAAVFKSVTKMKLKDIGLYFDSLGTKGFGLGIQNGAIFALIIILVLLVTHQAGISAHTRYDNVFYYAIIMEVVCCFIFACVFEILYRGCVLRYLKTKYTTSGAIIVCSLIYAFFSIYNGYTNSITILNNFLMSCILCIIALKFNSLNHAIGFRFAFATVLYYIFSFSNHGVISTGIFNLSYKNVELLNGGSFGAEGGLIFTFCALAFVILLLGTEKRNRLRKENFSISRKNICIVTFLLAAVVVYAAYDINIWKGEDRKFDEVPVKTVQKYTNANCYSIDWTLDVNAKKLSGTQEVDYINTSKDNLNEVCFHMYAAAFKKYNGDIKIENVSVDDKNTEFSISGNDNTILNVPLENILTPGKTVKIKMKYIIDIPERSNNGFADRFAYSNNAINLGNCFPIAAVYENGTFDKHPYDEKGDAFYSETSNFSVKITVPSDYTLAVTGNVDKTQVMEDGSRQWFITADSVRDFAAVASNKLQMVQGNVNGTIIKSYAFNKSKAEKALDISADAIKTYNKRIGEYPYGTCSVVETDLNGGMEYPTMVMILSEDYNDINLDSISSKIMYGRLTGELEFTIVHELAHQWWYGLIGDDEFNEAYVDEPLAQFSSLLYIKDKYGKMAFDKAYNGSIVSMYNALKPSIRNNDYKRPLNEYNNDSEYTGIIYGELPMKIKEYYDKVGDSKFNSILQDTFNKYEFKILKGKDYPIPLD